MTCATVQESQAHSGKHALGTMLQGRDGDHGQNVEGSGLLR